MLLICSLRAVKNCCDKYYLSEHIDKNPKSIFFSREGEEGSGEDKFMVGSY